MGRDEPACQTHRPQAVQRRGWCAAGDAGGAGTGSAALAAQTVAAERTLAFSVLTWNS